MSKTLLILGGSSDIGMSTIEKLHENFDNIIAHYYSTSERLENLKEKLGNKLHLMQADFSDNSSTEKFVLDVENIDIPTHILHLPAAKFTNNNFHKSKWDDVQKDIDISLRSIYKITNHFIKKMIKSKNCKIVFMLSSVTAQSPKFLVNYTMVKYALLGFMKSLAVEYADKHININALSPSMIETKFLQDIPNIMVEQSAMNNPMKRNANVEDIMGVIELLLSEKSNYITGQNIVISGGSIIQ